MKKLLLVLLTALLLAGCTEQPPAESTEESTQATEPTGIYAADSETEKQTGGAVRVYPLEKDTYFGLYSLRNTLLLEGEGQLQIFSGENCVPTANRTTGELPVTGLDVAATGIGYYDQDIRNIMIFNPQLQSVTQFAMPTNMVGLPIISLVKEEVYYSTGKEIRAMHIDTGISRLIRQKANTEHALIQCHFDGTVLACRMTDQAGQSHVEYISTETGQTLSSDQGILSMQTHGDKYYIGYIDGNINQTIFGSKAEETKRFLEPESFTDYRRTRVPLLAMNGLFAAVEKADQLECWFFDFASGKCTAKVNLAGLQSPVAVSSDGQYVWILAANKADSMQALYRWDIAKSSVQEDTLYTAPFYTAQNPDEAGLAACQKTADDLGKKYDVKITLWKDALGNSNGHTLVGEFQTQTLTKMLEGVSSALSRFPEDFLAESVDWGNIHIALVRSINAGEEWAQFRSGDDYYVLLAANADAQGSLIQALTYAVDTHVLGNSRDFDTWGDLNPGGFKYAYSYHVENKPEYLDGDSRAFTDLRAMSYPHEDRCRMLYYAMMPENEVVFASDTMQKKLRKLCLGIREAYGLEKSPEVYLWEQYLEKSVAYVKN